MRPLYKFRWLALALLALLGMAWELHPLPDSSAHLSHFPRQSASVNSHEIALADAEKAVFSGAAVLKRLALVRNQSVIVTVIDGTRNRHAVHDPMFCFRGAGWEITREETIPLRAGAGRLLHLGQGADVADALYWYSDGDRQFSSPLLYWWKTCLRRLTFGRSGPEPVLVLLTSTSDGLPDWPNLVKAWPELQAL